MLDKESVKTLWSDAIAKYMTNFKVSFKIIDDNESVPRNHQFVKCLMIFDVKMENFRRKVRIVAGGHMKKAPVTVTYVSVVSREPVYIALTIAALNDLQVKCGYFFNAFITAPVMELIWTTLGPEFGDDQGNTAIFVHALYGLKSSGSDFRKNLVECMSGLGYKPCLSHPNLWLKPEVRYDGVDF